MKKLAILTGSTALALTVLPMLENNYAAAAGFNDDNISTQNITYPAVDGEMKAVLAKPKDKKNPGCVVVIHENRGLNPHIIEVTKRIAAEGFLALGIDALSPLGGTPADEDRGREMIGKLDADKNLQNYLKGLDYLRHLGGMTVPVLYIAGAQDMGAPAAAMEAMAAATPGAAYRVIPDCAHIANLNQPYAFTAALSEFLEV